MPAVFLERLKLQSANLAGKFSRPEVLAPMLRELLSSYSNRTFREQITTGRLQPTPSYHVPEMVLRQVERDLLNQLRVHTQQQALSLGEALWDGPSLEEKSLAVAILGEEKAHPAAPVARCFVRWYQDTIDPLIKKELAIRGGRALRAASPREWARIEASWVASPSSADRVNALRADVDRLALAGTEGVPQSFRLLKALLAVEDPGLLPDLVQHYTLLAARSPTEAAFFLERLGKGRARSRTIDRFLQQAAAMTG